MSCKHSPHGSAGSGKDLLLPTVLTARESYTGFSSSPANDGG